VKTFQLHPQAKADLLSGAEYYERESWAVVGRFAVEMDQLVQEICANPGVFRVFRSPARRHFGSRFPYAVIYVDEADHVLVLAFAHFKRKPGYWIDRLLRLTAKAE
jgi:plasmid stabilization system protein ParE